MIGILWGIISPAIERYNDSKDITQEEIYYEDTSNSSGIQNETTDLKFNSGVLFQNDNITITLIGGDSRQLSFEIENIGKEDITYKLTGLCVNGIMQNGYNDAYQGELPSKKKSKLDVSIRNVSKKYDSINSVEIAFSYYTENDYAIITNLENCSLNDWVFSPEYSSIENEDTFGIRLDGYDICVFPESVACVTVNFTEFMSENNINEVKDFEFTLSVNEIGNYINNWEITNIKFQK